MLTPYDALVAAARRDGTAPRLTWYDRSPGPTDGERIELSGRVLLTWTNKAANLLQSEFDAEPGTLVGLVLPTHWRACYWALATWAVGATVTVDRKAADVIVTDDADLAAPRPGAAVLVTMPALARRHPVGPPPDVLDEAAVIAGYPDDFVPWAAPTTDDSAIDAQTGATSYAEIDELMRARPFGESPRLLLHGDLADVLVQAAQAWAAGGSAVLVRGLDADADLDAIGAVERVSDRRGGPRPSM
jgi:uncharacterized protein (TIGR03089 family)